MTRLIWRRWRGRPATGVDRVCLAYLRHFGPRSQAVVQHERMRRILDPRASQSLFKLLLATDRPFKPGLVLGAIGNAWRVKGRGEGRIYLNVGHTGLNSRGFRDWVSRNDVRPVYFVHDLIPITHPQYCRPGEDGRHRARIRTVLETAAGVIGNSQVTLDDLARFARAEDLGMPTAIAAWLGTEAVPQVCEHKSCGGPTFVTLGTIEARKNHMLLLKVWSRLIERMGTGAPRLMIIGGRGWEADPVFNLLDHDEKLRQHVVELNNCTDQQLAGYLAASTALLFPSHVEGYGLPLVEALSSGAPVIASDLPVFREIGGDIPTYVSPDDDASWERAILDYADPQSAGRAAQLARMSSFRAPDWASHFARVERWLRTVG